MQRSSGASRAECTFHVASLDVDVSIPAAVGIESEMLAAWADVRAEFDERDVSWRGAAYIVALSRLAEAHNARGLWP